MKQEEITIPTEALRLSDGGDMFRFEMAEPEGDKPRFRMVANSGGVIEKHAFWQNFAIDMDGIRIGRQRKPALRDHDPGRVVGFTDKIEKTSEGLVAEGFFTETTDDGREVLAMAREGFPWQASIYIPPDSIEKVPEGKTAEVNGNTLEGPGHIFRKSWLREVTFTALGADENTHAVSLSNETSTVEASVYTVSTIKEDQMSDNLEPVDLEPEITEEAIPTKSDVELAVEKERGRISQILSAKCTGQDELAKNLIESGVSLEEAQGALLSDVKSRMEDRLSTIITESPAPAGMEVEVEETQMNDEDRWLAEFQNDKNIQGEFGESKFYINYKKGISGGSIKPSDGRI